MEVAGVVKLELYHDLAFPVDEPVFVFLPNGGQSF